jgi:hypothetical protein
VRGVRKLQHPDGYLLMVAHYLVLADPFQGRYDFILLHKPFTAKSHPLYYMLSGKIDKHNKHDHEIENLRM